MVRIYLIRHGRTTHNEKGLLQGKTPKSRLTPESEQMTRRAAKVILDVEQKSSKGRGNKNALRAIVTSPTHRTEKTAEIINKVLDAELGASLPIQRMPEISARDLGRLEDRPSKPVKSHVKLAKNTEMLNDMGVEEYQALGNRAFLGLKKLIESHGPQDSIIVATHGEIIRNIITKLRPGIGKGFKIPHGSITAFDIEKVSEKPGVKGSYALKVTPRLLLYDGHREESFGVATLPKEAILVKNPFKAPAASRLWMAPRKSSKKQRAFVRV